MSPIIIRSTLLALITAYFLALPAMAQQVTIVTESFPPFNYLDDEQKVVGISTDIIREAFERAGIEYNIELLPWKRAVRLMEDTPNVFIYTMARNHEREKKFLWVEKLFDRKVSLFRSRGRSDLADLSLEGTKNGYSICAVDGTAAITLLHDLGYIDQTIVKVIDDGRLKCPSLVSAGRADFLAANTYSMQHLITSGEVPDIFAEQFVIHEADGYYLATNKLTEPDYIRRLRIAFRDMKREGYLNKVAADYLKLF